MREEARIDRIIEQVTEIWKKYPDWRFGQLVSNLTDGLHTQLFYIEDDKFEESLEKWKDEKIIYTQSFNFIINIDEIIRESGLNYNSDDHEISNAIDDYLAFRDDIYYYELKRSPVIEDIKRKLGIE